MLCRLVAHHSCAIIEAGERGLADILSLEFEPAPDALSSVLTFCDMTTSPDRQRQDQRRPHIRIGRHGRSSARIGVVFCRRCEQACDQPDELAAECLRGASSRPVPLAPLSSYLSSIRPWYARSPTAVPDDQAAPVGGVALAGHVPGA